jgi:hypothetical protein
VDTNWTATSPLPVDAPVSALTVAVVPVPSWFWLVAAGGFSAGVQAASVIINNNAAPIHDVPRPKCPDVNRPEFLKNLTKIAMLHSYQFDRDKGLSNNRMKVGYPSLRNRVEERQKRTV